MSEEDFVCDATAPQLSGATRTDEMANSFIEPPSTSEMIDKLRTIKPFNEKQLSSFYQNCFLDQNSEFISQFIQNHKVKELNRYYESLVKLERFTERFLSVDKVVTDLRGSIKDVENICWKTRTEEQSKWDTCEDGQRLQENHQFNVAEYNHESVRELEQRIYFVLRERVVNEHMVSHYYQRFGQLEFELDLFRKLQWIQSQPPQLSAIAFRFQQDDEESNDEPDEDPGFKMLKEDFHTLITALFVYFRKRKILVKDVHKDFKQSLILLCQKFLNIADLNDRLFLLNHILRCQSGSSTVLAKLIVCPDPLPNRMSNYGYGKHLVDFCVTVLATILSPVAEGFLENSPNKSSSVKKQSSQEEGFVTNEHWLMVDPEFDDEIISLSSIEIAEIDLITYLKQVPFENCLRFMGLLDSDDGRENISIETSMMKLFAFNTRLIQILRSGLENFNCLRFKELTLFLSSMIKQIIRHASLNWTWCKEKFTSSDQALLLRLQVEFDNFMLRSITALLSTNRRGVWPLLAQVEFLGITEQMLWHILWVVYNNGLDKASDTVGGLCPYMSANYWKDKFARHHQWKFIFVEKISEFSIEEAASFMDFLYNMAMSRQEETDSDFLEEIVRRIAEICLLKRCISNNNSEHVIEQTIKNQEMFTLKGTVCLISLLNHFKTLTAFLMEMLDDQNRENNQLVESPLLQLFESLNFSDFIPSDMFFRISYKWLVEKPPTDLLNRLGRVCLTKVCWNQISFNSNSTSCLLIEEKLQRSHAYHLFLASSRVIENNLEQFKKSFKPKEKITLTEIVRLHGSEICEDSKNSLKSLDSLSVSTKTEDFFGWIWRSLMLVRIHPLSFVPDEASLDEIIFNGKKHQMSMNKLDHATLNLKHRIFSSLPKPSRSLDEEFGLLFHEFTLEAEKQNPFGVFVMTMMSEWVVRSDSKSTLEAMYNALKGRHHQMLHFLYYFIPMNLNEVTFHESILVVIVLELIQAGFTAEVASVVLNHLRRFRILENVFTVAVYWTELLLAVVQVALQSINKNSWLSSMNPTNFMSKSDGSTSGNNLEDVLCGLTKIFDQLAEAIIFHDANLFELYSVHFSVHRKNFFGAFKELKIATIVEHPPNRNNLENIKQNKTQWNVLGMLPWASKEEICKEVFYLTDKNALTSEYLTPFHVLLRQSLNKKILSRTGFNFGLKKAQDSLTSIDLPLYLVQLSFEIDLKRFKDIWNLIVFEINQKQCDDSLEKAIKNVCKSADLPSVPLQLLPINNLIIFLLNSFPHLEDFDVFSSKSTHPLLPLMWRSFFQLFFSNTEGSSSVGLKLVNENVRNQLTLRLNLLYDQHNERWKQLNRLKNSDEHGVSKSTVLSMMTTEERLFKFYKSCKLWLNDIKLHNSYVNFEDDPQYTTTEFQRELFKSLFTSESNGSSLRKFYLNFVAKRTDTANGEDETLWFRILRDQLDAKKSEKSHFIEQNRQIERDVFDFPKIKAHQDEESIEDVAKKIGQYGFIINYFSEVSSLINVDLLSDEYLSCFVDDSHQQQLPEFSSFIMIVHQLVDAIIEEARLVESQLMNFSKVNQDFVREILPNLYFKSRRVIKKTAACDRQEFDASGCSGNAKFVFEFEESILDDYNRQRYEQNRQQFEEIMNILVNDVPVQKVVASVYFLERVIKYILRYFDGQIINEQHQQLLRQMFQSMTGWIQLINSVHSVKYIITVQVLDLLLELLSSLSEKFSDRVNLFILDTSLQKNMHSSLLQQLAPYLNPAKFQDSRMFIEMYKLIGENLANTSQQTVFVLLSKFDVSAWLTTVSDEGLRFEFLEAHLNCLKSFGISPSEEFIVTFDLYRKHLQDLILLNFPNYLPKILENIFSGMIEFKIAPKLWNSILHTFGFYTKSLSFTGSGSPGLRSGSLMDFDFQVFDADLTSYVYRQTIFNSHDLYSLCQLLISLHRRLAEHTQAEILDHFKVYVGKYIQFLGFISFCWIHTNATRAPDDIHIVWDPLIELWRDWIFVAHSTKYVAFEHLSFVWQMWLNVFQYACHSLGGRYQDKLLSLFWCEFLQHILKRGDDELEHKDVEMFEEKLLSIKHWNKFEPSLRDIELMYEAIIQERHSLERFVSFVITKINWPASIKKQRLTYEQLSQVIDNLSCVLICLSNQPNIFKLNLNNIPFGILDPENVKQLCFMLFPAIKSKLNDFSVSSSTSFFKNSEIEGCFDLSLLYALCNLKPVQNLALQESCHIPDSYFQESWTTPKMVYYTNVVASIVSYFCNVNQENLIAAKKSDSSSLQHIRTLLKVWGENINPLLTRSNPEDQILVMNTLLNFLSQVQNEELQSKLTPVLVGVFSYTFDAPELIGSVIIAINRTISSTVSHVYLLEAFVELFLDLNGSIIFLIKNLQFSGALSSEESLNEIKNKKAYLLLLLFVYTRLCNSTVPEKCTLEYVFSLFMNDTVFKSSKEAGTVDQQDEAKLLLFLTKIFSLLTRPASYDSVLPRLCDSFTNLSFVPIDHRVQVKNASKALQKESSLKSLETLMKVGKNCDEFITDALSRSWFFFKTSSRFSNWCLFTIEVLVLHGLCCALEVFFPNDIIDDYERLFSKLPVTTSTQVKSSFLPELEENARIKTELFNTFHAVHTRLFETWRKDKTFVDMWHSIDELSLMFNSKMQQITRILLSESSTNPSNVAFTIAEHLSSLQTQRYDFVEANLLNKFTDKNFVRAYLRLSPIL